MQEHKTLKNSLGDLHQGFSIDKLNGRKAKYIFC